MNVLNFEPGDKQRLEKFSIQEITNEIKKMRNMGVYPNVSYDNLLHYL